MSESPSTQRSVPTDTPKGNGAQPQAQPNIAAILSRIDRLEEDNRQKDERIATLQSLQDPGALHNASKGNREPGAIDIRLRLVDGLVVTKIDDLVKNEVRVIGGREESVQIIRIHLEDATTREVSYQDFKDLYVLTSYLPVKRKSEEGRKMFYTVEYNGVEFTLDKDHVN